MTQFKNLGHLIRSLVMASLLTLTSNLSPDSDEVFIDFPGPCDYSDPNHLYTEEDRELCQNEIMTSQLQSLNEVKDNGDSLDTEVGVGWSPINIITIKAVPLAAPTLTFSPNHWDLSNTFILTNTGSYPSFVRAPEDTPLVIYGGPIGGFYKFHNLHFHWDQKSDCQGSEHAINGVKQAMEAHAVYHSFKYNTLDEAKGKPDGIVVCAFLLEIRLGTFFNHGLEQVNLLLPRIKEAGSSVIADFNPLLMMVNVANSNLYYHYQGSLTGVQPRDPVSWIVFVNMVQISPYQIQPFRQLLDSSGNLMDNVDDLQDLKNRTIYFVEPRRKPDGRMWEYMLD